MATKTNSYVYKVLIPVAITTKEMSSGAEQVEKRLTRMEKSALKAADQFDKLSTSIAKAEKANASVNNGSGSRRGGIDTQMLKAMTDIARMQRQQESAEKQLTRQMEREAKTQANFKAKEMRRAADAMIREIDRVKKAESQQYQARGSGIGGDLFSTIFGATSASGLTVNAIGAAVGQVKSLISDAIDLGVQSVRLAGDFETTVNALAVFTGGISDARYELSLVDKDALDTPGLRLETAEQGFQRLRALNFEAKTAQGLIKGLGTQRLLSGAQDTDVQRVIVNFQQLSSSSANFSRDFKEIVHAIPSLRGVFEDAFGTLDTGKLRKILEDNPQEFFRVFSAQLANSKQASAGFNVALENLSDTFILAGREFGEPILDPLTEDLKDLTSEIQSNKDLWRIWGEEVAGSVTGAGILARGVFADLERRMGTGFGKQAADDKKLGARLILSTSPLLALLNSINDIDKITNPRGVKGGMSGLTREKDSEEDNAKILLETLKNTREEALAINDNYYKEQIAKAKSFTAYSLGQQLNQARQIGNLKRSQINSEIAIERKAFEDIKKFGDLNDKDLVKAQGDLNTKLLKLNTDLVQQSYSQQKELDRIDREIILRKRAAVQELNQINSAQVKQGLEITEFDFNRSFSLKGYGASAFNNFRDQLGKNYADLTQLSSDYYRGQLLNESLTAEERNNILAQLNQAQSGLAEDLRRKMLDIGDKQYTEQIRQLETYREKSISTYQNLADFYKQIGESLFNPQGFGSQTLGIIQKNLLRQNELQDFTGQISEASAAFDSLQIQINDFTSSNNYTKIGRNGGLDFGNEKLNESYGKMSDASQKLIEKTKALTAAQDKLKDSIAGSFYGFENLAKQISDGNIKAFDEAQKKFLEYRHLLETAALQSDIDTTRGLIVAAEAQKDVLKQKEYEFKLSQLLKQQESQRLSQAVEKTEQYRNSLAGLTETLEKLRAGDKSETVGFDYAAQQTILREQISNYGTIAELQARIASVGSDAAERYKIAWLDATLAVKEANIEAVESQIQSQVQLADAAVLHGEQVRAKVLDHLAEQKTLSEAFADGIIGSFDKLTGFLNKSLGKIGDVPIVGDLLKFANQKFASSITQKLLDTIFPGMGEKSASPLVSPMVEQQKITNNLLKAAFGNPSGMVFGGGGATGGGSKSILGKVLGTFGVGNSGATATPPFTNNVFPTSLGGAARTYNGIVPFGSSPEEKARHLGLFDYAANSTFTGRGSSGGIFSKISSFLGSGAGQAGLFSIASSLLPMLLKNTSPAKGLLGGAFGFVTALFNRGKVRKQEEQQRTAILVNSRQQISDLIKGVNNDSIDGDSALSQASQIRQDYLTQVGQLTDKKTRNIAIATVRDVDSLIGSLKTAVNDQKNRRGRLSLLTPTFADGGAVSKFATDNFRNNPLGYISGPGTSRSDSINAYFPAAGALARISNREYVLDAQTTAAVGIHRLDRLRQSKGRNFNAIFSGGYADGGAVSRGLPEPQFTGGANGSQMSGGMEFKSETNVYVTQDGSGNITDVKTETFIDTPQGRRKLESAVENIIYDNGRNGKIPTALNRVAK